DVRALQYPVHIAAGLDHGPDVRVQHSEHTTLGGCIGEPVEIGEQRGPLTVVQRRPRVIAVRTGRGREYEYVGARSDQRVEWARDVGQRIVSHVVKYHGHE